MGDYTIDSDIPLSKKSTGAQSSKYPFARMNVGDSFALNGTAPVKISTAAYHFGRRQKPRWKFTVRKTDTEHRCWRIK